jgi:molybdopterin/thiamine biosynthesis adenylyltransferase
MIKTEFLNKLKTYGIYDRETFWADAFSRDIGLLSRADQMALAGARVAIAGLGGVGGVHLVTLARAGVGKFHIADFDVYEPANMNRQFGATVPALGRAKLDVMEEEALAINPFLEIRKFDTGVTAANVDDFLDGVDVVMDGVDFFCFEARRMVFNRARAKGIPVVTAGPLGYSSALLVFSPDGMSFDDYFDVNDQTSNRDALIAFAVGLAPRSTHGRYMDFSRVSFNRRRGPVLGRGLPIVQRGGRHRGHAADPEKRRAGAGARLLPIRSLPPPVCKGPPALGQPRALATVASGGDGVFARRPGL